MPKTKLEGKESSKGSSSSTYTQNLLLLLRLLPVILDHLSDIPVLYTLWYHDYLKLFLVGLAIDLLPGPVAAYQFYLLGYKRSFLLLLFQPVNILVFTLLAVLNINDKVTVFAKKVAAYCHECSALLESPLQVVFTVTLICIGVLPAPWHKSFKIRNSFGTEIDLAFFPTLSVVLSLISIGCSASANVNLMENVKAGNARKSLSWVVFLAANIMFRLQAWTILSTFLAEFVAIIVLLVLSVNLATFLCINNRQQQVDPKVDPILSSIYSLAFPITFLKSLNEACKIEEELSFIKRMNKLLAVFGVALLLSALWITYAMMPNLKYDQNVIVERDLLSYFMVSTSVLAGAALLSTAFLGTPAAIRTFSNSHYWDIACNVFRISIRMALLTVVVFAIVFPYVWKREQVKVRFSLEVCGEKEESVYYDGYGYSGDIAINQTLFKCPAHLQLDEKALGNIP